MIAVAHELTKKKPSSEHNKTGRTIFNNIKNKFISSLIDKKTTLSKLNELKILNDIMIINLDNNSFSYLNPFIYVELAVKIDEYQPSLIIVTTQNAPEGTMSQDFQHEFSNFLTKQDDIHLFSSIQHFKSNKNYKLLTKISTMRKSNSTTISFLKSMATFGYSRNTCLKTRIYYNKDKVLVNFKNNRLLNSSITTNNKSFENQYNSNTNSTKTINPSNNLKMIIERYYMKRYTSIKYHRSGIGRISIGLQIKLPTSQKLYTLIVSNYNTKDLLQTNTNYQKLNNTNHKALNSNNYFKNKSNPFYAILLSPQNINIYRTKPTPNNNSPNYYSFTNQLNENPKNELKFYVDNLYYSFKL
jgi:hypothetical protein